MMNIDAVMNNGPVIPVIVVDDAEQAVLLARALVTGGIHVLEITLRTAAGLDAIRSVRQQVPEAIVGVGTITRVEDLDQAMEAGAQFGVSPGSTPELLAAVKKSQLPFLPGAMTPSEVLKVREAGFTRMKLFPAEQAGGVPMLKAMGSVFPDVRFCPTGGIKANSAGDYLSLSNVSCVGGSWLAPLDLMRAGNWQLITTLAQQARGLQSC